jgi:hypothetical protein
MEVPIIMNKFKEFIRKGFLNIHPCFCILTALFLISCVPAGKVSVLNVNDNASVPAGSFIYALPLTVIDVHVISEETTLVPGPYQKYAKKYLSIENVPDKYEHEWNIKEVQLSTHLEADPDYIYIVSNITSLKDAPGIVRLINDSMILETKRFFKNEEFSYFHPKKESLVYTDLSIKRNFEAEKDIEVSLVMPDTNYLARSFSKNTLVEKTLEQKAEEAANFLIKLKKRRFKLVAGQYEAMPEGEAMSSALSELSRIEEEYLSLFIGKKTVRAIDKYYQFIPVPGKETDRTVLFRFSDDSGFVDPRENKGMPVVVDTKALNKLQALEQYKSPLKTSDNILLYRIADQVSVKIIAGEQVWAEALYPVFQAGALIPMNIDGTRK